MKLPLQSLPVPYDRTPERVRPYAGLFRYNVPPTLPREYPPAHSALQTNRQNKLPQIEWQRVAPPRRRMHGKPYQILHQAHPIAPVFVFCISFAWFECAGRVSACAKTRQVPPARTADSARRYAFECRANVLAVLAEGLQSRSEALETRFC
ncbi:hypothetical protein SDC9_171681 [bioreactor metagenome]|uniref:Uncharacterized protein n=1 Tax=bioreactor metagenome TaxID=1076179 RepID=A0A645GDQ8_9ZZZZ